ncbi:MAG: hypothetical protein K9J37_20455 [Saprospiraceae bacterium]|nr:hypothetical protein [Saprospiraceae bacterium]MCF8252297.1 hypothetical protein [Saprospiraceae bacterium]MCF8282094.1 hypothetical protein [Bacteroidales bacterium]MCF8313938.1 hypothetical protein [Saprospiraceae bacterium]MCF8442649.1 hypothetical protein [Saprospiraceae bacterium]
MKSIRKIAAYLGIALLAFANMGAYLGSGVQVTYTKAHNEQSQLASASDGLPLYCLTEQRYGTGVGQGNGAPSLKQPLGWAGVKAVFLSAQQVTGANYFILSKYLLIGFSTTDAIYPFHQFW